MKRGSLRRTTPLRRGRALARRAPLTRATRLRPAQQNRADGGRDRAPMAASKAQREKIAGGWCVVCRQTKGITPAHRPRARSAAAITPTASCHCALCTTGPTTPGGSSCCPTWSRAVAPRSRTRSCTSGWSGRTGASPRAAGPRSIRAPRAVSRDRRRCSRAAVVLRRAGGPARRRAEHRGASTAPARSRKGRGACEERAVPGDRRLTVRVASARRRHSPTSARTRPRASGRPDRAPRRSLSDAGDRHDLSTQKRPRRRANAPGPDTGGQNSHASRP